MSFIRNAMLALAVAAAIPAAASAQGPGGQAPEGGQRRGGAMMQQMLMKDITLSESQQARIELYTKIARDQMRALGGQPGTPPDSATRAKREDIRRNEYAEIRKILRADQQKTFDANVAAMEKRMQEMRRN